jgi:hypothetical protein
MTRVTKEEAISFSLGTIVNLIVIIPVVWFLVRPIITEAVAEDMKASVQETVGEAAKPLNDAFNVLLTRDITKLRRQIVVLQFKQRNEEDWTQVDAELLSELQTELDALISAKKALEDR